DDNTYEFLRWNGIDYQDAGDLEFDSFPVVGMWIKLKRSQIGDVGAFSFAVTTLRGPDDAKVVDHAPDTGVWTYRLVFKPVIASAGARLRAAQPTAATA